jgi:hypothetical protein
VLLDYRHKDDTIFYREAYLPPDVIAVLSEAGIDFAKCRVVTKDDKGIVTALLTDEQVSFMKSLVKQYKLKWCNERDIPKSEAPGHFETRINSWPGWKTWNEGMKASKEG